MSHRALVTTGLMTFALMLSACGGDPPQKPPSANPSDRDTPTDVSGDAPAPLPPSVTDPSPPPTTDEPAPAPPPVTDEPEPSPPPVTSSPLPTSGGDAPVGDDFDMAASQAAFANTVYPILRQNCVQCHGGEMNPKHSSSDVAVAHEHALALVNLDRPERSRLPARLSIDQHNCWSGSCGSDGAQMLTAIEAWADEVAGTLAPAPEPVVGEVTEAQVRSWIAADRASLNAGERDFFKYISLHELHNLDAYSAADVDLARAGIAKTLNSVARFAPEIVLPTDISNVGLVYRIDIRQYWGYGIGSPAPLQFGGSDEDIFFNSDPALTDDMVSRFPGFSFGGRFGRANDTTVNANPEFAKIIWERITKGNYEGMRPAKGTPNVEGFHSDYVEASQLVYTLSRPDVYNAIMYIPGFADQLERQLALNTSQGVDSFIYATVDEAITIDERLVYRGTTRDGYYWKSIDQFSNAQFFPFYIDPIPQFMSPFNETQADTNFSFMASVNQDDLTADSSTFAGYKGGLQAQASEVIFTLPNGLQGYAIFGGVNQRRTDAFTFIVIDPRRRGSMPPDPDATTTTTRSRFSFSRERLLTGASCMGCHAGGLNRMSNDLRDMLDANDPQLAHLDAATKNRVRELYPTSDVLGEVIEADRAIFGGSMEVISNGMMLGSSKSHYEEPIRMIFETAQRMYNYENQEGN